MSAERRNAYLVFDLENFKIAWQTYYRTVLSYFDLCALLNRMEEVHKINIVSIKFYATSYESSVDRSNNLRTELKSRFTDSKPTTNASRKQLLTINRVVYGLGRELKCYRRLLNLLTRDEETASALTLAGFETHSAQNWDKWFTTLTGTGEEERKCQVKLEEFKLERKDGRTTQRGCDQSIVASILEGANAAAIDVIILMSGDSDFIQTLQLEKQRAEKEGRKKAFYMCSYLTSFPTDIRNAFKAIDDPNIQLDGVEYLRLEKAFLDINPQAPNLDPETPLKRVPIPPGLYEGDFTARAIESGQMMCPFHIREELAQNYKATNRRIEQWESQIGVELPYHVGTGVAQGKLRVSELIRNWADQAPDRERSVSHQRSVNEVGGRARASPSITRPASQNQQTPY